MKTFGLIGKNIDYSFSKDYFKEKFFNENITNCSYINFDIQNISEVTKLFEQQTAGFNVTIPYKEEIIPFLNSLSNEAKQIGAVNTIKINSNGNLEGHNTDYFGFYQSLKPHLKPNHKQALILGTGGASKAIAYALEMLNITYQFVSRNPKLNQLTYEELTNDHFIKANLIINTTPIGTFPEIEKFPNLPYSCFTNKHIAYDLIYNPSETLFLKKAKEQNATIINGLQMLKIQAEKAWEIWNK